MKKLSKITALFLCAVLTLLCLTSCSGKAKSTPVSAEDFRVTAYIVCGDGLGDDFDTSNLQRVTDIILFGNVTFDEQGNVTEAEHMKRDVELIKANTADQNIYFNILGPDCRIDSDDWNEQMYDKADRHTAAFKTGKVEAQIKNIIAKYDLDGVVFDYEYPLRESDWVEFDKFILSLDKMLGEDCKIGMAMSTFTFFQSEEAKAATDFIEVMSYDIWDRGGNHAPYSLAKWCIRQFVKHGYDKAKLDLGVPFYARPTTKEAYWYDYKSYYEGLDDKGRTVDSDTGLTFSFNTPELIEKKTAWALDNGVGGMMVWHYSCDVPAENAASLFGAIDAAKQAAIEQDNSK